MKSFSPQFSVEFFKHFPLWRGLLTIELQDLIQRLAAAMINYQAVGSQDSKGPENQGQANGLGGGLSGALVSPASIKTDDESPDQLWRRLEQQPAKLQLFLDLMRALLKTKPGQPRSEKILVASSLAVAAGFIFLLGMKNQLSSQSLSGLILVIKALIDCLGEKIRHQWAPLLQAVLAQMSPSFERHQKDGQSAQFPAQSPNQTPDQASPMGLQGAVKDDKDQ
jgi:hypothetical protein